MSELSELRQLLGATRVQVKAARNGMHNLLPMLAELERRLDALEEAEDAEPEEAERNGSKNKVESRDRVAV